jgi:hypothetical protein
MAAKVSVFVGHYKKPMLNDLKWLTETGKCLIKCFDTVKTHSVSDLGSYNTIFLCSGFHGQYLLHPISN